MESTKFLICGNPQEMNVIKKIETLPELLKLRNDESITIVGYVTKKGDRVLTSKNLFDRWTNKPSVAQEYVERGVFMVEEVIKVEHAEPSPKLVDSEKEYFENLNEERIPNQSLEETYPDIEKDAIAAKKFNIVVKSGFTNGMFLVLLITIGIPTYKGDIQDGVYVYVTFILCLLWNLYSIIRYRSIK